MVTLLVNQYQLLIYIILYLGRPACPRVVRTKYGDVSGIIINADNRYLDAVEVFRGIPYAMAPIGSLRFMPPMSPEQWKDVKLTHKFAPVCPQDFSAGATGGDGGEGATVPPRLEMLKGYLKNQSEDCLYLNIYTPIRKDESKMAEKDPVLVFIHGESFSWNSGSVYDGTVLSSFGSMVVVTVNYRLGILGFLNPSKDFRARIPANFGLLDQIAALHWIKENIAEFGGDPNNISLMGHGTGAACINFLMTSSAVPDGLFQRSILLSGSSLSSWALVRDSHQYTERVATQLNCSQDSTELLLKCLREASLEALLKVEVEVPQFTTGFGPSIDGVVIDPEIQDDTSRVEYVPGKLSNSDNFLRSFLDDGYYTTLLSHSKVIENLIIKLARFDILGGVVKSEAFFSFTSEDIQYGLENKRRYDVLKKYVKNTFRYHQSEVLSTLINEYTDWERPVQHPINIRDETLDALSDAMYTAPLWTLADLQSTGRSSCYLYVFDYQTKYGAYPQRQGCVQGEELPYMFGAPLVGGMGYFPKNYTKPEIQLSEMIMTYLSNFVRTGNPNEGGTSGGRKSSTGMKNIDWPPYESVYKKYFNFDLKSKAKNHYRAHKLSFWMNLIPQLHREGSEHVPISHHMFDGTNQILETSWKKFKHKAPPPSEQDTPIVMMSPSSERTNSSSNKPLIVTISVGCVFLVLNITVCTVFFCIRHKHRDRTPDPAKQTKSEILHMSELSSPGTCCTFIPPVPPSQDTKDGSGPDICTNEIGNSL
uniref:Neuroligin-1 n=1 Tax=Cacopsylla melanoneura TaxID=428564 RepID=A0A8D8TAW7_9HEMI